MRFRLGFLVGALLLCISAALADKAADEAKAARLSKENFDKIDIGDSKDDVSNILGKPSADTRVGKDDYRYWRIGVDHNPEITVKFHEGKVVSKKSTFAWASDTATPADAKTPDKAVAKGEWTAKSDDAKTTPYAARINLTHSQVRGRPGVTIRAVEPAVASPLVMVMDVDINTLVAGHAIDLRTGAEKEIFTGVKLYLTDPQFSPDLQYIATKGNALMGKEYDNRTDEIYVWDLAKNKQMSRFPGKAGKLVFVTTIGFINNDQIVMNESTSGGATFKIGDIHTGQTVRAFQLPHDVGFNPDKRAFSPAGTYLASTDGEFLNVIDLSAGSVAGHVKIAPEGQRRGRACGIAFSPTGNQIAVIGESSDKHWLVFVDSATGKITQNLLGDEFESKTDAFGKHIEGVDLNGHNAVEWLPNGKSIRFGHEILDIATGKVLARFTHNDPNGKVQYAKILSDSSVLVFDETFAAPGKFVTQAITLK